MYCYTSSSVKHTQEVWEDANTTAVSTGPAFYTQQANNLCEECAVLQCGFRRNAEIFELWGSGER